MSSMIDYMLDRDLLQDGVKLPLHDQDGKLTEDWIRVRSMHSDEFQKVLEDGQRLIRDGTVDREELTLQAQVQLVADWSFKEECTPENVREFLLAAPHIASRIDKAGGNNALFFPPRAGNSLNGHGQKSSSPHQSETPDVPCATT